MNNSTVLALTLTKDWQQAIRNTFLVFMGAAIVGLLAQLYIPLEPVPITGQSLGVLLVGAALGWKRGSAAMLLYLVIGGLGLPVFQNGAGGLSHLTGSTAGYLVGFVAAAACTGFLAEHGYERKLGHALGVFLAGHALIFIFGITWLAQLIGLHKAVELGFIPFIPGLCIKTAMAAAILPAAWRAARNTPGHDPQ